MAARHHRRDQWAEHGIRAHPLCVSGPNPFAAALAVSQEYTTGPDTIEAAKADYVKGKIEADLLEYRVGRILEREDARP